MKKHKKIKKLKLLKLEYKLLQDDVTNKQIFIDTMLQHKSPLIQIFDVSRISLVTRKVRKQPSERQHYEKKDTEFNNQQKQEENKSS